DPFYRFGSEEVDIAFTALRMGLDILFVDEGNIHLHVPTSREGNDLSATISRTYFGIRRYSDYERSAARLCAFLFLSFSNAVGYRIKTRQFRTLPRTCVLYIHAVFMALKARRDRNAPPMCSPYTSHRDEAPSITVMIPTYRRPQDLVRCIHALLPQCTLRDEVLVVCRENDLESFDTLSRFQDTVIRVGVGEPGTVAALRAGFSRATKDLIAITDDDAVPRYDWLTRIREAFSDPTVGAAGGRDVVHKGDQIEEGAEHSVGTLTWYGKPIGNHHLGVGTARDVDFLKGCNTAFRNEAFSIPMGLLG